MDKKPTPINWAAFVLIQENFKNGICSGEVAQLDEDDRGQLNRYLAQAEDLSKMIKEKLDWARKRFADKGYRS